MKVDTKLVRRGEEKRTEKKKLRDELFSFTHTHTQIVFDIYVKGGGH